MSEATITIGTELSQDELAHVHGGKNIVEHVIDAGKWVVSHADELKKVYNAAKKVWNTITSWF